MLVGSRPTTLAFVESTVQLDALCARPEQPASELLLVAATPEADYAAERRGLRYQNVEQFYEDAALMERGVANFGLTSELCSVIDASLREALAHLPPGVLISAQHHFYQLKRLLDALLHRAVSLRAVLERARPDSVLYFAPPAPEPQIDALLAQNRLTARVLPLVAERLDLRAVALPPIDGEPQVGSRGRVRARMAALGRRARHPVGVLWHAAQWWRGVRRAAADGPVLIVAARGGLDADAIAAQWRAAGLGDAFTVRQLIEGMRMAAAGDLRQLGADARAAAAQAWRRLDATVAIRALFRVAEIDLYPLVRPCLQHLVETSIPEDLVTAETLRRGLARLQRAVVLLPSGNGVVHAAAVAAGHPVVVAQHGGAYGYLDWPIAEHDDLRRASHFVCWGPGVAASLAMPSPSAHLPPGTPRAQPVAVGSPGLDGLVARHRGGGASRLGGRTVVFVLTNLGGDRRYFSYHMYPDIWFWRLQRRVIETCLRHPGVELIVKLYPSNGLRQDLIHNPIYDWLTYAAPTRCRVEQNVPFRDLLPLGDLFVMDTPATTLLEALTTTKPVITFADRRWVRFDPRAVALLRKRAMLADSAEEFLREIDAYLQRPDWRLPEPVNDEFLMAYGTHLNDGRSAERAVVLLRDLALRRAAAPAPASGVARSALLTGALDALRYSSGDDR